MNRVEELLLKAKKEDFEKKETQIVESERLAQVLGLPEPVEVEIQEIDQRKLNSIIGMQIDADGDYDKTKSFDAKLMLVVEGLKEPSMKSKELQAHFEKSTPKELAELIIGRDVTKISNAIGKLSGIEEEKKKDEEQIKN